LEREIEGRWGEGGEVRRVVMEREKRVCLYRDRRAPFLMGFKSARGER